MISKKNILLQESEIQDVENEVVLKLNAAIQREETKLDTVQKEYFSVFEKSTTSVLEICDNAKEEVNQKVKIIELKELLKFLQKSTENYVKFEYFPPTFFDGFSYIKKLLESIDIKEEESIYFVFKKYFTVLLEIFKTKNIRYYETCNRVFCGKIARFLKKGRNFTNPLGIMNLIYCKTLFLNYYEMYEAFPKKETLENFCEVANTTFFESSTYLLKKVLEEPKEKKELTKKEENIKPRKTLSLREEKFLYKELGNYINLEGNSFIRPLHRNEINRMIEIMLLLGKENELPNVLFTLEKESRKSMMYLGNTLYYLYENALTSNNVAFKQSALEINELLDYCISASYEEKREWEQVVIEEFLKLRQLPSMDFSKDIEKIKKRI